MHQIKITRAKALSATGAYHKTFAALVTTVPESLLAQCTARQLATIIDIMRDQYLAGHSTGYREAQQ